LSFQGGCAGLGVHIAVGVDVGVGFGVFIRGIGVPIKVRKQGPKCMKSVITSAGSGVGKVWRFPSEVWVVGSTWDGWFLCFQWVFNRGFEKTFA